MSTTPNFTATPRSSFVTISTANTSFAGDGAMGTVIEAGATGTRIDAISITASATTTAGIVALFTSPTNAANTSANTALLASFAVTAVTPSATVQPFQTTITSQTRPDLLPIFLPVGHVLRASTTKAETFKVWVNGGDF